MTLLAIDPGVAQLATACFKGGALAWCAFVPREVFVVWEWDEVFELVIERPRITGQTRGKDPNDQLDLTGAAYFAEGAIRARGGPPARYVTPSEWKGMLDKPIHHERVWSVLSALERRAFERDTGHAAADIERKIERACDLIAKGVRNKDGSPKEYAWKTHNLLDAVGLGLWHLGRVGIGGRRFSLTHEV